MITKIETFLQSFLKNDLPDIRPGDTVRVHQKMSASLALRSGGGRKERGGEKSQIFEGIVIARKHGKGIGATITVRKVISGIGVEKIFPIHSPTIGKIEVLRRAKVRRAKLYYLRTAKGKKARLKRREFVEAIPKEEAPPEAMKKEEAIETNAETQPEAEKKSEKELEKER